MDVKCVTCSLLYVYLTAQASASYSTTAGCAAEQALSVGDRTSCCFSSESPGLAARAEHATSVAYHKQVHVFLFNILISLYIHMCRCDIIFFSSDVNWKDEE